jgi:membrane protease YdiL (CAAX protease family)
MEDAMGFKTAIKIILILLIGFILMGLRPSISMSLGKLPIPTFSNFYLRELIALLVSMLILMTVIIVASRENLKIFGFTLPVGFWPIKPIIIAFLAGAASSAIGSLFKFKGPDIFGNMTFLKVIVSIWLFASIYEELVVRGFIQSSLAYLLPNNSKIFGLSLPVIISGLFFGLSHIALLSMGANPLFVILVVLFAIIIGLLAAYYREKSGSLIPAIIIHIAANIGGTLIGHITGS